MLKNTVLMVWFIIDFQTNLVKNFFLKRKMQFLQIFFQENCFPCEESQNLNVLGQVDQNKKNLAFFETNGNILLCSLH